jgi:hypothetical protein
VLSVLPSFAAHTLSRCQWTARRPPILLLALAQRLEDLQLPRLWRLDLVSRDQLDVVYRLD